MVSSGNADGVKVTVRVAAGGGGDGGRDGAGLTRAGVVGDVGLHGQGRAAQVGGVVLGHERVADGQRVGEVELDRELDAGVVVGRDLVPVHVVLGEHQVRVVGEQLERHRVGRRPDQVGDVEREPRE
jgi:hypothetical protein